MDRTNENHDEIPVGISQRREDLAGGLKQSLVSLPFTVDEIGREVTVHFQELLICGVHVEEENYKIFHVSSEWKDKTTYHCEEDEDGTWFYYLETIDECIGEVNRLVMFEAKKSSTNNKIIHKREKMDSRFEAILDCLEQHGVTGEYLKRKNKVFVNVGDVNKRKYRMQFWISDTIDVFIGKEMKNWYENSFKSPYLKQPYRVSDIENFVKFPNVERVLDFINETADK
jgi:hypothetical protein